MDLATKTSEKLINESSNIIISTLKYFFPKTIKKLEIKVRRIKPKQIDEVEEFIELYESKFPNDGNNYTKTEMLELLEDIKNENKHVKADNIILVALYKTMVIGFVICHYYPEKKYGIISYLAKNKDYKDAERFVTPMLLSKLKQILMDELNCELLVFEFQKTDGQAKLHLFNLYSKNFDIDIHEVLFDYCRPKLNLENTVEENLMLLVVPLSGKISKTITKDKLMDILHFIHYYCYGDVYDQGDRNFIPYQKYLDERLNYYKGTLPPVIPIG